ncbi:MAG: lysozyme [Nanoarchaeota archaeon]|nr:lysozyme [Nanoarchaeota archaeon]MBU1103565.1 lysozyme [Nanoarchaeota archaeon]
MERRISRRDFFGGLGAVLAASIGLSLIRKGRDFENHTLVDQLSNGNPQTLKESAIASTLSRPYNASQEATDFIKNFEQFRARTYNDQGGRPTIGYGHLIKHGEQFDSITEEQAESILRRDLSVYEDTVNETVRVGITQNQYDSLVSLTYNIGPTAFRNSTLVRKLNAEDYHGAAEQFDVWRLVNGKVSKGLVKRRAKERQIFEHGVYDSDH